MNRSNTIGKFEAIMLMVVAMVNQLLLSYHKILADEAGNASWITVIYISILALLFCYLISKLFKKFNDKDILDVSKSLFGRWFQIAIGILYLLYFFLMSSLLLREFSEELKIIYFIKTPITVIIAMFLIGAIARDQIWL